MIRAQHFDPAYEPIFLYIDDSKADEILDFVALPFLYSEHDTVRLVLDRAFAAESWHFTERENFGMFNTRFPGRLREGLGAMELATLPWLYAATPREMYAKKSVQDKWDPYRLITDDRRAFRDRDAIGINGLFGFKSGLGSAFLNLVAHSLWTLAEVLRGRGLETRRKVIVVCDHVDFLTADGWRFLDDGLKLAGVTTTTPFTMEMKFCERHDPDWPAYGPFLALADSKVCSMRILRQLTCPHGSRLVQNALDGLEADCACSIEQTAQTNKVHAPHWRQVFSDWQSQRCLPAAWAWAERGRAERANCSPG